MLDLLRQQDNQQNQNTVQAQPASPSIDQTQQSNNTDNQRLTMDSNSLDSVVNKHSRNLIDLYA